MPKVTNKTLYYIINGILTCILGGILAFNRAIGIQWLIDIFFLYVILTNILDIFITLFTKEKKLTIFSNILRIIIILVLKTINLTTSLSTSLLISFVGIYQLFEATINYITFYLYYTNKISGKYRYLIDALLYTAFGLGCFFIHRNEYKLQFYLIGAYLFLLGLSLIRDGIFYKSDLGKTQLKRAFRMNLPIFITAFIPMKSLEQLNKSTTTTLNETQWKQQGQTPDLEVFIHVSDDGFGKMGHVDLCYNNEIISYGCYDALSTHLGGSIGDGVLFKVDRNQYIEFCKVESNKTLFCYGLSLSPKQKEAVNKKIDELHQLLIPFNPSGKIVNEKANLPMYSYRLKQATNVELYKFKASKFKKYFVMSTNCVLLADTIIGQAGIDILSLRGFINPGTYLNYLEKQFQRPNSIVISKTIYQ